MAKKLATRLILLTSLFLLAAAIGLACGGAATPVVVEKEVVVVKEVVKEVTKEVVVTQEVVKEVIKEVVVTQEVVKEIVVPEFPKGTKMKIVQWSHFVPQYDKWFDPFAKDWGKANGVDVSVDHVAIGDLFPTLSASIDAGQGPTMVELLLAASLFVEGLQDLTDVNMKAQDLFGPQAETCTANSYLPSVKMWYGYCHGWVPDPGDYNQALWSQVGYPDGPVTWADLLDGGKKIKDQLGIPMGLGLSPEIDSEMAARAIMWSYGGSIQDKDENVVINSPEVIEAVNFMAQLYKDTMTEEVFAWSAASNNQGLIAGELSYILNSISAYRSLQKIDPAAADDIFFTPALKGPRGDQHASAHVWQIYVIPNYVKGAELEAAKAFLLHHTANYNQAVFNSELYNFPAFKRTVPQLYEEGGWLDLDPYGSRPNNKLKLLANAEDWVTYLGFPGPSNPAVARIYATHIIPTMMGKVALGELTAEEAIAEAEAQINDIFEEWRAKGFVGGGS
ncbi:MAG: extracellular solute-binding protein [Chloroflexi bacterium]|nr:extracellular solute-binding protein [Chloroflexota bacterium]